MAQSLVYNQSFGNLKDFKPLDPKRALLDTKGGPVEVSEAGVQQMLPVAAGASTTANRPLFKWEITQTPKSTTIHIFPDRWLLTAMHDHARVENDVKDALTDACRRYLDHLGADGTWVESMMSFCVRVTKSIDSVEIAKKTIAEFENGLFTRLKRY